MATDSAVTFASPSRSVVADPTRHIWQVPLFLVSVCVFVSAWQGWLPLGTPDSATGFLRDVIALQSTYERVTPDRVELQDLLGQVAANIDANPEHAPLGHFVLGSGYVRLAELTPEPEAAREHWLLAKQHFEQVRNEDLKDSADPPRLAFRSAKARAAIGLPKNSPVPDIRLLMTLLGNVPFGDEPGDAARLQADLAMRMSPPDLNTAREALTRYLTATGIATPAASLARAKYLLGDIHLRRKEPELARKWLEQIGAEAPSEVNAPARALLAQVRMAEDDWAGAARDWEALRALTVVPPELRASSAYHLAMCKSKTGDPAGATKLFEEAAKGESPEATAAAIRLAGEYLKSGDTAKHPVALELLTGAVKGVTEPKEFRNPNIRINEARAVFELAISTLSTDGGFDMAIQAAERYQTISEPGRYREKRAEAMAAWATALEKSGGEFKPKAIAAAQEYEAIANILPAVTAKADGLRRAAALYKTAGDPQAAIATLEKAARLPQLPDSTLAIVWAELAEALLAAKRPEEVWAAFNQIMASGGPVSTATRYRLARQFADTRHAGLAPLSRALFEQIAKQETVNAAEQEYHERALVELAHEFIRANNYPEAEIWLRKQLGFYPLGPEAPLGRLLLGVCLLQRASAPAPNTPDPTTATRLRDDSIRLFKQIVTDIDTKQKKDGKLGDRDAWLRLQGGLRTLQAYQQLQRPTDLLADAAVLLDRHRNTIEELIILSLVYHAFKQKGETGKALETRDKMKELFDRLPPTVFTATAGEYSRVYWEKVWFAPDPK